MMMVCLIFKYTYSHLILFSQAQKPKIEKIRRDRINGSLKEMKELVLEALKKDVSACLN